MKQKARQMAWIRTKGYPILSIIASCLLLNLIVTWCTGISLFRYEMTHSSDPGFAPLTTSRTQQFRQKRGIQSMPPRVSSTDTAGFVHIGKTGGSTISQLLRNGCTSFVTAPCRNVTNESVISKFVEHYYHVPDFHRLPETKHKAYIVSVRDAFDRTVSSFLYHHPENAKASNTRLTRNQRVDGPLAYECFPTLEAFAKLVGRFGNSADCNYPYRHNVINTEDCPALACAVFHGRVRFFTHLFFNYRNIMYTKLPKGPPPRTFYVIRQEKLWDDWTNLNHRLGQQDPVVIPSSSAVQRNVSGVTLPVTKEITPEGRQRLCEALELEYQAYFELLIRAVNTNDEDLEFSQNIAKKNCANLDIAAIIRNARSNTNQEK